MLNKVEIWIDFEFGWNMIELKFGYEHQIVLLVICVWLWINAEKLWNEMYYLDVRLNCKFLMITMQDRKSMLELLPWILDMLVRCYEIYKYWLCCLLVTYTRIGEIVLKFLLKRLKDDKWLKCVNKSH